MLTLQEIFVEAYQRGHAWNPAYPNLQNLDLGRVQKMTGQESDTKDLVRSLQMSDANYSVLVQAIHQRLYPDFDGIVGPATQALVNIPRCPLPDFTPPPTASFHYDDPLLQKTVERMQRATGSGSWPYNCHGQTGVHTVKISYDFSNAPSNVKSWEQELKTRSQAGVAAVGVRVIEVPVGDPGAQIRVSWRSLAGSTIGLAEFNNGTCSDSVFCYLDPNYAPDLEMVLILLMHENGHNWNLEHSSGFIMNPSILRVRPAWVVWSGSSIEYQDVRYPKLKGFFGGLPLTPDPGPGPGPTPGIKLFMRATANGSILEAIAKSDFSAKKDEIVQRFTLFPTPN